VDTWRLDVGVNDSYTLSFESKLGCHIGSDVRLPCPAPEGMDGKEWMEMILLIETSFSSLLAYLLNK
jgi:hypothetical protein